MEAGVNGLHGVNVVAAKTQQDIDFARILYLAMVALIVLEMPLKVNPVKLSARVSLMLSYRVSQG